MLTDDHKGNACHYSYISFYCWRFSHSLQSVGLGIVKSCSVIDCRSQPKYDDKTPICCVVYCVAELTDRSTWCYLSCIGLLRRCFTTQL